MAEKVLSFIQEGDGAELRELSRVVQRFAETTLAVSSDQPPKFNRKLFDSMSELGLSGAAVSEKFGGSDLSPLDIAAITFELSRIQLGPAVWLSVHYMVSKLIERWGSGEVVRDALAALASGKKLGAFCLTEAQSGSDAAALRTRATRTAAGYSITGEKVYITSGGHADLYLVFARTGEDQKRGISAFLVEKNTPGISFGPEEKKMGCEGSPICTVTFDGCEVPEGARISNEGDGYKIALSGLAGGRINIGAAACGLASQATTLAARFALERKQFGRSISEFQGLQFMLADMVQQTRAAILLTRDAAYHLTTEIKSGILASISKCFATDAAMRVTTDAVQIFGGAGYLQDYAVERLMRDAKMLQIVEGTNQIQRELIARELLTSIA